MNRLLRIDGNIADRLGLPGKPAPDTYLKAAAEMGVVATRDVVIEDATSGVHAARAGGLGLVIGIDRTGDTETLRENGADSVLEDLSDLV